MSENSTIHIHVPNKRLIRNWNGLLCLWCISLLETLSLSLFQFLLEQQSISRKWCKYFFCEWRLF